MVEEVILLAGQLIDAIDIYRSNWVLLVYRYVLGLSIKLTGAGINNADIRIVLAACFKDRELRGAVDIEVGIRVLHRVHMAGLAGQVKECVLPLDEVLEAVRVSNIGNVDGYVGSPVGNIGPIAAIEWNHGVHDGDLMSIRGESQSEVGANKAHATGDKNAL